MWRIIYLSNYKPTMVRIYRSISHSYDVSSKRFSLFASSTKQNSAKINCVKTKIDDRVRLSIPIASSCTNTRMLYPSFSRHEITVKMCTPSCSHYPFHELSFDIFLKNFINWGIYCDLFQTFSSLVLFIGFSKESRLYSTNCRHNTIANWSRRCVKIFGCKKWTRWRSNCIKTVCLYLMICR